MKTRAIVPGTVDPADPRTTTPAAQAGLAGHGLPGRWQGRARFVMLATGFGRGDGFLAAWAAWRQDPARCERLVFVAIEPHPLRPADLARAHAASPLPELAGPLVAAWPPLTPGLHLLDFDGGRMQLLLGLGEVRELLRELVLQADAISLGGLVPTGPAAAWDAHVLKRLARLAAPGATASGAPATAALRAALAAAGFEAGEAQSPMARFAPRHPPQRPSGREPLAAGARRAVILGAGLAGAACALALSREGLACTVIDALAGPAQASSGNPAGLFHGTVNPDDGPHARFNRAAALATQAQLAALGVPVQPGLLRLETRLPLAAMPGVPGYVQALSAEAASALAGTALAHPAWFYPGGGAVDPGAYTRALLAASGAALRLETAVASLRRAGDGWQLCGADGRVIDEAPLVVLAGGHGQRPLLATLPGDLADSLVVQRGQLSHLPDAPWCPAVPMAGEGYAIADGQGGAWCGATTQDGDPDPTLRPADQQLNLARYARLAGLGAVPEAPLAGRVGWRLIAPDRLPLIGGVGLADERAEQLRLWPRQPGLVLCTAFASRGISWAALAGRLVAALALGTPRPLEAELLDAVDPLRFALRRARRGAGAPG